jgi:thiol-disulfide isomerase/thioredoxin
MKYLTALILFAISFLVAFCLALPSTAAVYGGTTTVAKSSASRVIELTTPQQVKEELAKSGPVIIMYHAEWCGACKMTEPQFHKASEAMSTVRFYMFDVDKIGLKEHKDKIRFISMFFVGRDEASLRAGKCSDADRSDKPRTSAQIKLFILDCLGTLP